jgi:hypothetical protein
MPLDYSFEITPSFRGLTPPGLGWLRQPLARSVHQFRCFHRPPVVQPVPAVVKATTVFRRSPPAGSLSTSFTGT